MKIRIDSRTYGRVGVLAQSLGVSRAEVVRRCLRCWLREGGPSVVNVFCRDPTTRAGSEAYEMDLGGFEDGLGAREVLGVVRWRLAKLDWSAVRGEVRVRRELDRRWTSAGCVAVAEG